MDIDEKLKEEQLEYYKRENELREEALKRQKESINSVKNMFKAFGIVFLALMLLMTGYIIFETIKMIINDYHFYQSLKLH